ncbi:hypothetical protein [Halosolutus halophilus]|uniref:hypothetical protein n=1 Tax=Halosolutus halophilus TaxID=1552990 RepID=UPI0022351FBC|nr:hypothetical protein [Halosolutus halophilus]
MQPYRPPPMPPGHPNERLQCENDIDGDEVEGFWLERENWQSPNTHELYCLACRIEKLNEWANQPDVADEADVKAHLSRRRARPDPQRGRWHVAPVLPGRFDLDGLAVPVLAEVGLNARVRGIVSADAGAGSRGRLSMRESSGC